MSDVRTVGVTVHEDSNAGPAIVLDCVSKSYGRVRALNEVTMSIRRGAVLGVLGPNGAGKTTLLRVLLGLVRIDAGSVEVLGQPPGSPTTLSLLGAMIENPAFVPGLTGRDNLRVLTRAKGLPDSAADRVLTVVDMVDAGSKAFKGYSMGMKQRLGVAAALLGEPGILILDEPTNGLDPEGVVQMRQLLAELGRQGNTILISSHMLHEVELICDSVALLNHGELVAVGSVSDVLTRTPSTAVRLVAGPRPLLESTLNRWPSVLRVRAIATEDDAYEVVLDQWGVPRLIEELVKVGVSIGEVTPKKASLEDAFFSILADSEKEAQQ